MSRNLTITPVTCKLDYSYETVRQLNLFCRVILGNVAKSTEVVSPAENTNWNSHLSIPKVSEHMLHVEIHNRKENKTSDLIGVGEWSIMLMDEGENTMEWINIRDKRGKINGKVLVEFNFNPEKEDEFSTITKSKE